MTGRSRFIMLAACALQVFVVAGSIAWVAITGSGGTVPVDAQNNAAADESDPHDYGDDSNHDYGGSSDESDLSEPDDGTTSNDHAY